MKIVFLSNYYNHHQAHISEAFYKITGGSYRFIETGTISEERKKLGYKVLTDRFVINYNENDEIAAKAQELIDNADILIVGAAPEKLIYKRKKSMKLIFRYSERPLKKGFQWWKYPLRWHRWHSDNPKGSPIYMLCASAYTALDYSKFGLFKNKTYKWGYFPGCKRYDSIEGLISGKKKNEILWCGRFLDWKHPDDALQIAKRLQAENYDFHMSFIGTGEMESVLKEMTREYGLSEKVSFLGSMPPENVRECMEQAGIYLFTSDKKEGWGAVLNESMNSGCAVVASHLIGSVPYMLKDRINGSIYESGNLDDLFEKTKYLLDHPKAQDVFGKTAYETVTTEWNANISAQRFVRLCEAILAGEASQELYSDGPCSRAEIIQEKRN